MSSNQNLRLAQTAYDLRQFAAARRLALAALADDDREAAAFLILGNVALKEDKFAEARGHAENMLAIDPDSPAPHLLLGWSWLLDINSDVPGNLTGPARPRIGRARETAREALSLAPDFYLCYRLAATVEWEEGKHGLALQFVNQGLALEPTDSDLLRCRGSLLCELGQHADANLALLQSLRAEPENPDAHHAMAKLKQTTGHYHAAILHVRELMRLSPDYQEGATLYWELIKTQHPLLRGIGRVQQFCARWQRLTITFLVIGLFLGIPMLVLLSLMSEALAGGVALIAMLTIIFSPRMAGILAEILPTLTDALWLWLGRDQEQPLESLADRLIKIELAAWIICMPLAIIPAAMSNSIRGFLFVWGGVCVAVLHNFGLRLQTPWLKYALYTLAAAWLIGLLIIGLSPATNDQLSPHLLASIALSALAAAIYHFTKRHH